MAEKRIDMTQDIEKELLEEIEVKIRMVLYFPQASVTLQEMADYAMVSVEYIEWLHNITMENKDKDEKSIAEIVMQELQSKPDFFEREVFLLGKLNRMSAWNIQRKKAEIMMQRKTIFYGLVSGITLEDLRRISHFPKSELEEFIRDFERDEWRELRIEMEEKEKSDGE